MSRRSGSTYGKKIGVLEVKLDRKKTRYQHASVEVELRFDISNGTFWAQWEGNWHASSTKDELTEKIKVAATKALSIEWKRYIQIEYDAEGWPVADPKTGRPEISGRYHTYEIGDDRTKHDDDEDGTKYVVCQIALRWSLCEISEPYSLPEEPTKKVRSRRSVEIWQWGEDTGKEKIGDPEEWEDDILPPGTLLWTPEREAVLAEVVAAIGKLDARLIALFAGDADKLAGKLDAAAQTDAGRLLAAPAEPKTSSKRRRA